MFPIPWNFPFRKKNGDMSTIGDVIGGAGSELPPHSSSDAGKLLGVKPNGSLEWSDTVNSEIQTLTNNVKARAELSAYNLLNIFNSEINTSGTYTEVINDDGTVTIGGTPTSGCTIPYKATAKYNGSVYNLKPSTDYVLDSGLSAISPLNLQVFVKENSGSSWAKIEETTTDTKLSFTTPASFYDIWVRILVPANAVVTTSTIVKPMIILASDVTIGFTPYAMTNRELTEVAQQIESGYIIKTDKTKSLISVTADGVKTYGTLFSELRTALLTYLANHTDEYCEILGVDTGAGLLPITPNSNALGKLYHSGDTLSIRFYGFAFADDGTNIRSIDVYSGSASYKRYFISQSQFTSTDSTDSIASSGTVLALHIRIYTKVS